MLTHFLVAVLSPVLTMKTNTTRMHNVNTLRFLIPATLYSRKCDEKIKPYSPSAEHSSLKITNNFQYSSRNWPEVLRKPTLKGGFTLICIPNRTLTRIRIFQFRFFSFLIFIPLCQNLTISVRKRYQNKWRRGCSIYEALLSRRLNLKFPFSVTFFLVNRFLNTSQCKDVLIQSQHFLRS